MGEDNMEKRTGIRMKAIAMHLALAMAVMQLLPACTYAEEVTAEPEVAEEAAYIEGTEEELGYDIQVCQPGQLEPDAQEDEDILLIEDPEGYLHPDMECITEAIDPEEDIEYIEEPTSEFIEEIEEPETEADIETAEFIEEMAKEEAAVVGEVPQNITVDLYFVNDPYSAKLTPPAQYPQQYQIDVSGLNSPRFVVEGSAIADISETGLVTPHADIWYHGNGVWVTAYIEGAETKREYTSGETIVQVYDGNEHMFTVTVRISNYLEINYENRKKEIEASIDTSGGQLQIFTELTRYIAENFDYDVHYSGGATMMAMGGGDCWGSTHMLYDMAKDMGLDVRTRSAATDPLAGSGHMNVLAKIDGEYYVGDAGYNEEKPRYFSVSKEPGGLMLVGNRVNRYEGSATVLEFPKENGWDTIDTIGCTPLSYGIFYGDGQNVECIKIHDAIKNIYSAAFTGCPKLERIEVDPENTVYKSIDGVLYRKDEPTLVRVPPTRTEYTIPDGITKIASRAFRDCEKLTVLNIPSSVTTIGYRAFYGMTYCDITIPASVTSIDSNAFNGFSAGRLIVEEGSYAAQFCADNKIVAETYHVADNGDIIITHAWNKGKVTKEASCEEDGVFTYTCEACKGTRTEAIPALGHETQEVKAVDPDCLTDGNIRHYCCTRCNQLFMDSKGIQKVSKADTVLPALGHSMVKTPFVAATCTEDGNDEYFTCSRCKKTFLDAEGKTETYPEFCVNRALGHRMEWVSYVDADCTHDGHRSYYTCSTCKRNFLDYAGTKEASPEDLVTPATGHSFEHFDRQEPGCTYAGNIEYSYCSRCYKCFNDENGAHEIRSEDTILQPLGHDLKKVGYKAPSCIEYGQEEHYVCSRCGGVFTDGEGKDRTTEWHLRIALLPHNLEYIPYTPNSCETGGVRAHYRCTACNRLFYDEDCYYKTTEEEVTLQATGHALCKEWFKAPTCKAEGNIEYWECISCGKLFSDEKQTRELQPEDIILERSSHIWSDEYVVTRWPTRTSEGIKAIQCSVCWTVKPGSEIAIPRLTDDYDYENETGADEDDWSWAEGAAYQVRPKTISQKITKLKARTTRKKVKLTWKKLSAGQLKQYGITGIQVQVSTSRKFKTIYKEKKLGKAKTSWNFKGKAKKTYYIRMRYYGNNACSGWCKTVKVKLKK